MRSHHSDRSARQQEELIQMLEEGDVGIEVQYPPIACLSPCHELCEGGIQLLSVLFSVMGDRDIHWDELDLVPVPRLYQKLAVPVCDALDLRVPLFRVQEYPIGLAAEALQSLKDHDGVAQVGGAGGILEVGIARPIDILVP